MHDAEGTNVQYTSLADTRQNTLFKCIFCGINV